MRPNRLALICAALLMLLVSTRPNRADALYVNVDLIRTTPVISVCWEDVSPAISIPNLEDRREWVREAVEQSWGRYAPISFTGWGECTSSYSFVRIRIIDSGESNASVATWNPGANNGMDLNLNQTRDWVEGTAIHEFGHVLGFYHEEEREDYEVFYGVDRNSNGTYDVYEGACVKQDWHQLPPDTFWIAANNDMEYLGAYDIDSIMSYCGSNLELSPGDIAGVQYVYGTREDNLVSPLGYSLMSYGTAYAPYIGRDWFHWSTADWHAQPATETGFVFEHRNVGSDECLGTTWSGNGASTWVRTCDAATSVWEFERVAIRGWGGLCLASPGGATSNYTMVHMENCDGGVNQQWSIRPDGTIRYGELDSDICLTQFVGNVFLYDCAFPTYQTFEMEDGRIRAGGRCVDVVGWTEAQYLAGNGLPYDGEDVQMYNCLDNQLNQEWFITGLIRNAGAGYCLNREEEGPDGLRGTPELGTCFPAPSRMWDIRF